MAQKFACPFQKASFCQLSIVFDPIEKVLVMAPGIELGTNIADATPADAEYV